MATTTVFSRNNPLRTNVDPIRVSSHNRTRLTRARFRIPAISAIAALVILGASAANAQPARCSLSLFDPRVPDDPPTRWNADRSYTITTGTGDVAGSRIYRVTSDTLYLSKDNLPSLARDANSPNTRLSKITFDARTIVVDMPMYFDSASVEFIAETVVFTRRGVIGFTSTPQQGGDGVTIVANRLDLTQARTVPFQFETENWKYLQKDSEKQWPTDHKRHLTISAISAEVPEPLTTDESIFAYFRNCTLDRFYGRDKDESAKPFALNVGNAQSSKSYADSLRTALWPNELAAKTVRFFAKSPYDSPSDQFLQTSVINTYLDRLPADQSQARLVLFSVSDAISRAHDLNGYTKYYVPRLAFTTRLEEFKKSLTSKLTIAKLW